MTADAILSELRAGPQTTTALMALTGASRNAVLCAISKLRHEGHRIDNLAGGKRTGVYRLADRVCGWPGCGEPLNCYNSSGYCLFHRRRIAACLVAARLDTVLDRICAGCGAP